MPIYEYSCLSCGHKFDLLVKMGAADPICPECGKETKKLVSAAGFILKGGGWYKDHYGLKKSSGAEASGGEAKPVTDSKPAGESKSIATETKPTGGTSGSGTPAV